MLKRLIAFLLVFCMISGCTAFAQVDDIPTVHCETMEDMSTWLLNYAQPCYTALDITYSPSLDSSVQDNNVLSTLLFNSGMEDWKIYHYQNQRKLEIRDIRYRAGYRLAYAYIYDDDRYIYTSQERSALNTAIDIVAQAKQRSTSTLEVERYLHDWLCTFVLYYESTQDLTVYDSCVGPLTMGYGECDGYADAFYLLCTLANIHCGYQYGQMRKATGSRPATHLWNVVNIDGVWLHVDVSYDDNDHGDDSIVGTRYYWFNVADCYMDDDRSWKTECTVYPMQYYMDWDKFFYSCAQAGEVGFGGYYETLDDAGTYVRSMQKEGWNHIHVMVPGYYENGDEFNKVLQKKGMKGSWLTWTGQVGEYTCFDIYID